MIIIKMIEAIGSFFADNMPLYFFYGLAFLYAFFKTYNISRKLINQKHKKIMRSISYIMLLSAISFITCYIAWARPEITSHSDMTEYEKFFIAISYIADAGVLPVLIWGFH